MCYAALITTRTPDAARRALGTFGDEQTRAAARELLGELAETEPRQLAATTGRT